MLLFLAYTANQSLSTVSKESTNTKFTAEEQFKITTWLPHQPVQCSSATVTANQPFMGKHSSRIIPQVQASNGLNKSVESHVAQSLHYPPEVSSLCQSVTAQQPPLVAMQENDSKNVSAGFEKPHSEAVDYQQSEHVQELIEQDYQHTSELL